jgi:hypothetical protein
LPAQCLKPATYGVKGPGLGPPSTYWRHAENEPSQDKLAALFAFLSDAIVPIDFLLFGWRIAYSTFFEDQETVPGTRNRLLTPGAAIEAFYPFTVLI